MVLKGQKSSFCLSLAARTAPEMWRVSGCVHCQPPFQNGEKMSILHAYFLIFFLSTLNVVFPSLFFINMFLNPRQSSSFALHTQHSSLPYLPTYCWAKCRITTGLGWAPGTALPFSTCSVPWEEAAHNGLYQWAIMPLGFGLWRCILEGGHGESRRSGAIVRP